ncbi:Guanosine-diphosphatase [Coniosporium tulheliwenetii]|uniref:Guanosine-diphosphatase n=1 Tax=Coniosporium tulheliwenetii TaxID=3383036 RepID=A0ACC2YQV6_9PEZI|nr:Guanosine-diphosphatase [Cladosporium sp. JES 115]
MSSSVDVSRRPNLWSYFSFTSNSSPRRRTSVSLPAHTKASDPFEKPDRHTHSCTDSIGPSGLMKDIQTVWMNQGQRARYLKTGGIIAFLILVIFYLAPGDQSGAPFPGGDVASDPSVATSKCTRSYSPHKPLIQYALMIDAGSTGSRIHVYRFNNCGPTPELEDEVFKQTDKKPGGSGLSSYGADAEGAAKSLDVLLQVAVEKVPKKLQACTPIAVKATAGLRKLGPEMSDKILQAVRQRIETERGRLRLDHGQLPAGQNWGPDKTPTAAVFDLGGGSTQIVFQPTFPGSPSGGLPEKMHEGDHKYELSFGGREFSLYQHSYLGYGLMEARRNIHKVVAQAMHEEDKTGAWTKKPVMNPCIAPGMNRTVKVELDGSEIEVLMQGPRDGSPAQCRALAEKTLAKEAECKTSPCAFNGVHQPSLQDLRA